jgi:acetylornithine deacetylase
MNRAPSEARAVDLLEELAAVPSLTGSEGALVDRLEQRLRGDGWEVHEIPVSPGRRNLFARFGRPAVVFTTHADTVPPFFAPRREGARLYGRGACDAKASLAAQIIAAQDLRDRNLSIGLLVLVGEERGSDGALAANPRGAEWGGSYLVGGEPTDNRFVAGCKGCLRISVTTRGVAGHSSEASPESAVPPMLDLLARIRTLPLPEDPVFGQTTSNIGVLEAGSAPNVVADRARAEILFRTGRPVGELLGSIQQLADGGVELAVAYRSEPTAFRVPRGARGEIVAFACDLPLLPAWGRPLLVGPGSIAEAHSADESVPLDEVERAVSIYSELASALALSGDRALEP